MTPQRWDHIQEIFHEALARDAAARADFLDTACAGDPGLRREVESLLDAFGEDGPVDALANEVLAPLIELRKALAVFRTAGDEARPRVVTLHHLAALYRRRGAHAAAEGHYREADAVGRALYGPAHPDLALGLYGLGQVAQDRGDETAAAYYRGALEMGEPVPPGRPPHPDEP